MKGETAVKERIKSLRKELSYTQQEFADKIGTPRNNIAGYETGKRSPSEAVISLICREFNVNEIWLRTGEGEMFNQTEDAIIERLRNELNASELEVSIIRAYFGIDPRIREPFMRCLIQEIQSEYAASAFASVQPEPAPIVPEGCSSRDELELEADKFAAIARAQFFAEKIQESPRL